MATMYSELLALMRSPTVSNRQLDMTDRRRIILASALQVADANLIEALSELLQYTGGWDLKDETHPIVKARRALERAGVTL